MSGQQRIVWVNGEYIDSSQASISPFDPGLTVGLGVFDSLCGYAGEPFDFEKHYKRLSLGAERSGLGVPTAEILYQALVGVMAKNDFTHERCRLRITLLAGEHSQKNLVTAVAVPAREDRSKVIISDYRVNEYSPLVGVKSTSYAANWIALQKAQQQGADEAIMLNSQGFLCEGATSNLFMIYNGKLSTPPLSSGCLAGVARDTVLEICDELDIRVKEKELTVDDLNECDEAFLTSSLREVQPIESVGGFGLPTVLGELTEVVQKAYIARVNHGVK